jgi:threonyl-tRNA synthetase
MPGRLGAEYVAADDTRKVPVMLHRAILGSLERFIGILIENFAGSLPLWLAPMQAMVLSISEKHVDYAADVAKKLHEAGFRVDSDLRDVKITYKIREHSLNRLPYQLVVGDKEKADGLVAVRTRGGQDLGQMTVEALIERLQGEVAARSGTA